VQVLYGAPARSTAASALAGAVVNLVQGFSWRAVVSAAAFGAAAGLLLYHYNYNASDLQAIRDANSSTSSCEGSTTSCAPTTDYTANVGAMSGTLPPNTITIVCTNYAGNQANIIVNGASYDAFIWLGPSNTNPTPQAGWTQLNACQVVGPTPGPSQYLWLQTHYRTSTTNPLQTTTTTASQQAIQAYIEGLPATHPQALEQHRVIDGVGAPAPAAQASVVTYQESITQPGVVYQDWPTGSQPAGSIPIVSPVPEPATPVTYSPTIDPAVTNADGSQTQPVTCSVANHDPRTFADVLNAHRANWQGTPLLTSLQGLQNLVWVSDLPTIHVNSTFFGVQTIDFSQWSWAFTALRSVILCVASIVAIRIIF
jgi:hypothetical protein